MPPRIVAVVLLRFDAERGEGDGEAAIRLLVVLTMLLLSGVFEVTASATSERTGAAARSIASLPAVHESQFK